MTGLLARRLGRLNPNLTFCIDKSWASPDPDPGAQTYLIPVETGAVTKACIVGYSASFARPRMARMTWALTFGRCDVLHRHPGTKDYSGTGESQTGGSVSHGGSQFASYLPWSFNGVMSWLAGIPVLIYFLFSRFRALIQSPFAASFRI